MSSPCIVRPGAEVRRARVPFRAWPVLLAVVALGAGCSALSRPGGVHGSSNGYARSEFVARPLVTQQDRAGGHFLAAIVARFDNDYETATRETALRQRPMVIAYRMPRVSLWIMIPQRYLPYVGLPNILAGEFVVPEFLQDDATPQNLSRAVLDLLNDAPRRERICRRFEHMLADLRQDTAQKAADAVMPYLERPSS